MEVKTKNIKKGKQNATSSDYTSIMTDKLESSILNMMGKNAENEAKRIIRLERDKFDYMKQQAHQHEDK